MKQMNMKLYKFKIKLFLISLTLGGILCVSHSCQYEAVPATSKTVYDIGEKY